MGTPIIRPVMLLVLITLILGAPAGYAQTPSREAIEKWQHMSESQKEALRQRFHRWESLSEEGGRAEKDQGVQGPTCR